MIGMFPWLCVDNSRPYKSKRMLNDEIQHQLRMQAVLQDAFAKIETDIATGKMKFEITDKEQKGEVENGKSN